MSRPVIVTARIAAAGGEPPGPAGIGVALTDADGQTLHVIARRIGPASTAEAEWRAAITALESALGLGARRVVLLTDSRRVLTQAARGRPPRAPALGRLWARYAALRPWFERVEVRRAAPDDLAEVRRLARAALAGVGEAGGANMV